MLSTSILAGLTLAVLAAVAQGCDQEGMNKCFASFKLSLAKAIEEEAKSKKYPKTCKAVDEFIICAKPTLDNCDKSVLDNFKKATKAYRSDPFKCTFTGDAATTTPNNSQDLTTNGLVSLVITTLTSLLLH